MSSQKQIQANRENARKSTGPRTDGGKMRSRENGLKHGLTSRSVVIAGETSPQFRRFSKHLMKELDPQDPVEQEIAVDIIMSAWRRRRSFRIEAGLFADEAPPDDLGIDQTDPAHVGLTFIRLRNDGDGVERLLRYEASHRRAFYNAIKRLESRRRQKSEE